MQAGEAAGNEGERLRGRDELGEVVAFGANGVGDGLVKSLFGDIAEIDGDFLDGVARLGALAGDVFGLGGADERGVFENVENLRGVHGAKVSTLSLTLPPALALLKEESRSRSLSKKGNF